MDALTIARSLDARLGTRSAGVVEAIEQSRPLNTSEFSADDVVIAYSLWNADGDTNDDIVNSIWNQAEEHECVVKKAVAALQNLTTEDIAEDP